MNSPGPLAGITVLALEQALAGPLCSRHLGDLGARIIKIERPGKGDLARSYDTVVHGESSYFVWLNRGKESVALDLKDPAASKALDLLVKRADVIVQNLAPGAVDRLGLGPDQVLAAHPDKIYCSISGYGLGGPYEQKKAFDLLLQGETGVIATTGNGDDQAKVGISVGDIGAGVYGAMAVLAALYERQRTGLGKHVQSSLFDALCEWMGYPLYFTMFGNHPPARAGVRHATVVPYGAYRCGDGEEVLLAVQSDAHWTAFCTGVARHPEWIDDSRFNSITNRRINRAELESAIEESFATATRAEILARLDAADIPSGDLNTIEQFAAHPQLIGRDRWREVSVPGGSMQAILPPFTLDGFESPMGSIPSVGQHTESVLREFGLDEPTLAALLESTKS